MQIPPSVDYFRTVYLAAGEFGRRQALADGTFVVDVETEAPCHSSVAEGAYLHIREHPS